MHLPFWSRGENVVGQPFLINISKRVLRNVDFSAIISNQVVEPLFLVKNCRGLRQSSKGHVPEWLCVLPTLGLLPLCEDPGDHKFSPAFPTPVFSGSFFQGQLGSLKQVP